MIPTFSRRIRKMRGASVKHDLVGAAFIAALFVAMALVLTACPAPAEEMTWVRDGTACRHIPVSEVGELASCQ